MFKAQLDSGWKIVTDLNLDGDRNWQPDYSQMVASHFRHSTYLDTWVTCIREQLYDFQLVDNSLIQFRVQSFTPLNVSYAYYECPYECQSYREFLIDNDFDYNEVRDELRADYEQYLSTCSLKNTVTPIRYDFSPQLYTAGLHPASHIHFGYMSHIRVGTKKVLKPLSFLLFILRQCYPNDWQRFVDFTTAQLLCRNIRDNLADVDADYWQSLDKWEMSLL